MRNLKKILALVLALVMTMSLVTIANAADFSDKADINYKEAVDVMTAIGVIDGLDTGAFNPNGTLTREQAAKIICTMMLGSGADKLGTTSSSFKDVAATRWSSPYIEYCASIGIIAGNGDGTFNPTGKLTGHAFAKMLLGALGYNSQYEGYTGAGWTVEVAKDAVTAGITVDGVVMSAELTREQATQMAFQALKATMVEYKTAGSSVVLPDGTQIVTSGSTASKVENSNTKAGYDGEKDGYQQFCEEYFSDLKLNSNSTDDFERPASAWRYKSTTVGTYAKAADASYTEEVKLGTIYSDLGLNSKIAADKVAFSVNGAAEDTSYSTYTLAKGSGTKIGGNGVLTEVYYDSDNGTAVVTLVKTYAGVVKGVHAATSSRDAYINVSPAVSGVGPAGTYDTNVSYSVDDVVLYTYSAKAGSEGVKSVSLAEQVTGELTAYTASKSVSIDGKAYSANDVYASKITGLDNSVGYEVTLTLDQYGYVLNVDTDKASGNYAVVLDAGKSGFDNMARLLFTDGTVKDVVLKDTTIAAFNAGATGLTIGDIVSYKVNSENKYTLTLLADGYTSPASGAIVTKGSAAKLDNADFANLYAGSNRDEITSFNGKTIFLIKDANGNYTSYTGFANVPTITVSSTGVSMAIYAKTVNSATPKTGVATVVYIDASQNATSTSSSKDVVFVKGSNVGSSYDSTKGTYYTYDAIINGEITTIDTVTQTTVDTLYTTVSYDKNNVATLSNGVKDGSATVGNTVNGAKWDGSNGTKAESNGVIGILGSYYTYADNCTVFYKDTDGNLSASSVSAITDDSNDKVFVKFVDSEISCIVIVEVAEGGSSSGDNSGYVVNTPATVNLTATGATVANAKVFYNGAKPASDIENLTMTVKIYSWASATGSWSEYATQTSSNAKIQSSDGVVVAGSLSTTALSAGNYKVTVTLSGSKIGSLTLFDSNVNFAG